MNLSPDTDKLVERDRYERRAHEALVQDSAPSTENGAGSLPRILQAPYRFYEQQLEVILQARHQVLEIGAGSGLHTGVLLRSGAKVTATDISGKSLQLLNACHNHHESLHVEMADMEKLPFGDASFDVVVSAGSLSYGDNQKVLNEIIRVLRPAGAFVCVDSLNHNPVYRLNRWLHYLRGERTRSTLVRMPTRKTIAMYAQHFAEAEIQYFGSVFWLMPIVTLVMGDDKAAKLLDRADKMLGVGNSAFKFVMIAKGKKV